MSRKSEDIAAWKRWNRTKSSADLDELNRRMNGIIQKEVNRWAGILSRDVLEIEALRLAKMAYSTFNPNRGVALSTHLTNYLQKLSRKVYSHQNIARIPEYQILKLKTFKEAWKTLEDRYNRDPSIDELALELRWSPAAVKSYMKLLKDEQTESVVPPTVYGEGEDDPIIHMIYHDLNPFQKKIFEHTTGYGGSQILSTSSLAKRLKITPSKLQYEKRKLVGHVKSLLSEF